LVFVRLIEPARRTAVAVLALTTTTGKRRKADGQTLGRPRLVLGLGHKECPASRPHSLRDVLVLRLRNNRNPPRELISGNFSMIGFDAWAAFAALGFLAVMALVSRPQQIWANVYVLAICLIAGVLFTAVKRLEPNRWLAICSCSSSLG